MQSQHITVTSSPRIDALKAKHKLLSEKIETEQSSVSTSDQHVGELKREKLKIKEEIEGIRKAS